MALWNVLFGWWRHMREERQDSRDEQRLKRESREELRGLYADLVDSAPDEEMRALATERRFRATISMIGGVEAAANPQDPGDDGAQLATRALPDGDDTNFDAETALTAVDILMNNGKREQALALLKTIRSLLPAPNVALARTTSRILEVLERFDEAIDEIDRLSDSGVPEWQILRDHVFIYTHAGRLEDANSAAGAVLEIEERRPVGLALQAFILSHQGEHSKAFAKASEACKSDPENMNLVGLQLEIAADFDMSLAKEAADVILDSGASDPAAYRIRALWFLKEDDYAAALQDASRLVELEQGSAENHIIRGRAFEYRGDHDEALKEFALAEELSPGSYHAQWHRIGPFLRQQPADLKSRARNRLQVISLLSAVIENPHTPIDLEATARVMRSTDYLLAGAKDIADSDFDQAKELGIPEHIDKAYSGLFMKLATLVKGEASEGSELASNED